MLCVCSLSLPSLSLVDTASQDGSAVVVWLCLNCKYFASTV